MSTHHNILTYTPLFFFSSPLSLTFSMLMNQIAQNSSNSWILPQPAMNYFQMFEKPLTPSDVGKLNRLVIPKQHAEKYFPLDNESVEKGLLLSFEDEVGKPWKFRYSYWTSSQSYVLTKGWSRYVKEKRLDAGDVIIFHRCDDRLFIGSRRRGSNDTAHNAASGGSYFSPYCYMNSGDQQMASPTESRSTVTTGNSRRLRLFGVNLECGPDQPETQHSWNQ